MNEILEDIFVNHQTDVLQNPVTPNRFLLNLNANSIELDSSHQKLRQRGGLGNKSNNILIQVEPIFTRGEARSAILVAINVGVDVDIQVARQ